MLRSIIKDILQNYFKDPSLSAGEKYAPVLLGILLPVLLFFGLILFYPDSLTTFQTILLFLLVFLIVMITSARIIWGYLPRYLFKNFEDQHQQTNSTKSPSSEEDGDAVEVEYEVVDKENSDNDQ